MNWGRFIVDAVFRGGDKHSNHGDTVLNMIRHMVIKIKRDYRWDVPIVIRMDSGFFDQKIFHLCEALQVGYVCGGKMYDNIKQVAANWDEKRWARFESVSFPRKAHNPILRNVPWHRLPSKISWLGNVDLELKFK
jgi:hypothetical protein